MTQPEPDGAPTSPGVSPRAAIVVRSRVEVIVRDWRSSCPTTTEVDHEHVLELVADALSRCAGNTRRGHRHEGLDEILTGPGLQALTQPDVTCLREVIRRQVLIDLPPAEAMTATHCVSTVLDELHERAGQRLLDEARARATTDVLTGLGNRRAADDAVATAVANARRHDRPLALLSIDIDHLKEVNDTLGHDAGDAVLVRLAEAIRDGIRAGDSAYRVGGDEFIVLLPDATPDEADLVIDRIRAAGAPSFSVGVASTPDEADTAETLIVLADHRLVDGRRAEREDVAEPPVAAASSRIPAVVLLLALVMLPAVVIGHRAWADDNGPLALLAIAVGAGTVAAASGLSYRSSGSAPLARAILVPLVAIVLANGVAVGAEIGRRDVLRPTTTSTPGSSGETGARAEVASPPTLSWPRRSDKATAGPTTSMTSSLAAPGLTVPQRPSPGPTTTTTTAPRKTTTTTAAPTTTTAPRPPAPAVTARDDEGEIRGRHAKVGLLENDDVDLDEVTVEIVAGPTSGTANVRKDGTLMYRADESDVEDRLRYRVCDRRGRCDEAWVVVTPWER